MSDLHLEDLVSGLVKITQAQMEAGEPNPYSDPVVNPVGSPMYREHYERFLSDAPFRLYSVASAVAILRNNQVLPNDGQLYDLTLSESQWDELTADPAFKIGGLDIRGRSAKICGSVDFPPMGVRFHVGQTPCSS